MTDQAPTTVVCEECGRKLRTPKSRAQRRGPVCQAAFEPPKAITPAGGALPRPAGGISSGPDLFAELDELLDLNPTDREGART